MKFNDVLKKTVLAVLKTGRVAYLRGEGGIGKSKFLECFASEFGFSYYHLASNQLAEKADLTAVQYESHPTKPRKNPVYYPHTLRFLNRFHGNLFQFNSISEDIYREIILKIYDEEYENVIKKKESYKDLLTNPMPDADLDEIVSKTYTKEFNARPAKEAVREYITDKLI